jgi:catechol 2,3-dioxygenase
MTQYSIHPHARVGHVHLRVSDLDRAIAFYRDLLGFHVTGYGPDRGVPGVAFLAAGDYHHHIALNTWETAGGEPAPKGHTGLHHFALSYPDRGALARAVRHLLENGYSVDHAADGGISVAVFLQDPDGNGVELSYDRPRSAWFEPDGRFVLRNEPFDPRDLLSDEGALVGAEAAS